VERESYENTPVFVQFESSRSKLERKVSEWGEEKEGIGRMPTTMTIESHPLESKGKVEEHSKMVLLQPSFSHQMMEMDQNRLQQGLVREEQNGKWKMNKVIVCNLESCTRCIY